MRQSDVPVAVPLFLIRLGLFGEHFYGAIITSSASGQKKVISHAGQCIMNPASVISDVSMEI